MATKSRTESIVKKMLGTGQAPHLIEITEVLVREFGGVEKFVKEMYTQYQAAPTAQKGSWMRAFVKMVEATTEMGGSDRDLTQMSEQDLVRELQLTLKGHRDPLPDV